MDVHLIYAKLVNDEGDMAGHVAYALYKRDKLKFIEAFRLEKGRHPSSGELEAFVVTANLALRASAYRSGAERALEVFSREVLEESTRQLEVGYQQALCRQLAQTRSLSRAVGENLAANLLAAAIVALLAVILYGSRIGLVTLVADVFGYRMISATEDESTPPGLVPEAVPAVDDVSVRHW